MPPVQSEIFYKTLFSDHWNNRENKRQRPLQASFLRRYMNCHAYYLEFIPIIPIQLKQAHLKSWRDIAEILLSITHFLSCNCKDASKWGQYIHHEMQKAHYTSFDFNIFKKAFALLFQSEDIRSVGSISWEKTTQF